MNTEDTQMVENETTELTPTVKSTEVAETRAVTRWVTPATDVHETPDGVVLVADIPGVAPDQVEVDLDGRHLTVSALRGNGLGYRRVFRLDDQIDRDGISAHAENGVLTLTLPRREELRRRSIPVR